MVFIRVRQNGITVLSDRITNLMAADRFFYPERGFHAKRRLEAERYILTPANAKRMLKQASKSSPVVVEHKESKPRIAKVRAKRVKSEMQFEEWQIRLAEKIMKGK